MRKQNDSSNYFDELDMWSGTSGSQKQDVFREPPKKTSDDLDSFFDTYGAGSGQRRSASGGRRSGGSGRKNPLPKLLTVAAVAVCAVAAAVVVNITGSQEPEIPAVTQPVIQKPAVQQSADPVIPAPTAAPTQPAPTQPAPVPQQEYRYFGKQLTGEQKKIYTLIQEGLARHADEIGPFNISNLDDIQLITRSINYDYPEYFWFDGGCEYSYYDYDTYMECTLKPKYTFGAQEYAAYADFVEKAAQPVVDQLSGKSDYEKVKGVYEYLIDNTVYDLKYTGTTLYEMFHDRRGVCEGYAKATQYLLTKLGVETLLCTGMAGETAAEKGQWESHAWNIVKIDGVYYEIDTTWGDPLSEDGVQTKNFWYLNLTDAEMGRQHEREDWRSYPVCNSTGHNYYVQEGCYLDYFDGETIKRWFQQARARGVQLEFKCANESVYRQAYSWLVDNNGIDEVIRTVIPQTEGYQCSYSCSDNLYIFSLMVE